jgi:hypothetical protein
MLYFPRIKWKEAQMQTQPGARTRHFGRVLPISDTLLVRHSPDATTQQPPQPLPQPTGSSPFHLSLDQVLSPAELQTIQSSGRMVFHIVGDTSGIKTPLDQNLVFSQMEQDLAAQDPTA